MKLEEIPEMKKDDLIEIEAVSAAFGKFRYTGYFEGIDKESSPKLYFSSSLQIIKESKNIPCELRHVLIDNIKRIVVYSTPENQKIQQSSPLP